MKTVNLDRYELLKYMPSGTVAEIGVATGRLSKIILENNKPETLVLIDLWKNFDLGYKDDNMVTEDKHEGRYQAVKQMFAENKSVLIVRDFSTEASTKFEDNYFDWVYVDADHSYEGCLKDLEAYDPKVKQDGYIWGHDWLAGTYTKKGFDVNRAVKDFVESKGYILSCITNEPKFASYVISKNQLSHDKLLEELDVLS
jgi:hypothetical protein